MTPLSQLSPSPYFFLYLLSLVQIVPAPTLLESCNPQLCLCPCSHCTTDSERPLLAKLPCPVLSTEVGARRVTKISHDTGAISKSGARIPAREGSRSATAGRRGSKLSFCLGEGRGNGRLKGSSNKMLTYKNWGNALCGCKAFGGVGEVGCRLQLSPISP